MKRAKPPDLVDQRSRRSLPLKDDKGKPFTPAELQTIAILFKEFEPNFARLLSYINTRLPLGSSVIKLNDFSINVKVAHGKPLNLKFTVRAP